MKEFANWFFFVLAFIFWPWAILFVDGLWLFFTGHVLTSVPWNELRVTLAVVWPMLFGSIAALSIQ